MTRRKPLEEDEPVNVARGVLDNLIAKHDPEAIREQGKDPAKVASDLNGGAKGGHQSARTSQTGNVRQSPKPQHATQLQVTKPNPLKALTDAWLNENVDEQKETFTRLKKALEENRSSNRKLFS